MCILRVIAFLTRKEATHFRLDAEEVEKAAGGHLAPYTFCVRGFANRKNVAAVSGHEIDQVQVVTKIAEVEIRSRDRLAIGGSVFDRYNPFGLSGSGERIEDERAQPTENRRVCAESYRQREHRDRRETGTFNQLAQRVMKVLSQAAHLSLVLRFGVGAAVPSQQQ